LNRKVWSVYDAVWVNRAPPAGNWTEMLVLATTAVISADS
jgi:hypothetical protein